MRSRVVFQITAAVLLLVALHAGVASAEEILYLANEPEDVSFVSMPKIAAYLNQYYSERGIVKPENVDKFYAFAREHGAPKAGAGEYKVGLVLQDVNHPKNSTGAPRGVWVCQGRFDHAKVLDMVGKNYGEWMGKTKHPAKFSETAIEGEDVTAHQWDMPGARKRTLTIVSFGNYSLIHSAKTGDLQLLNDTMAVLRNGALRQKASETEAWTRGVAYDVAFTPEDKKLLGQVVDQNYDAYKKGTHRVKKRKGFVGWLGTQVADHKVAFLHKAIEDVDKANFRLVRSKASGTNTKQVELVGTFENDKMARQVKRKLHNHLIKVIKGATSIKDKFSISSHVRIVSEGNQCKVKCQLQDEHEQMATMALIGSFAVRNLLRN